MAAPALYDAIGHNYATRRRPDPRIAARTWNAIGDASTILNVGAGTGSYEDASRAMVAVDPSEVMIAQRTATAGPVVRAAAEYLPFEDNAFDVALALMTVHHWSDLQQGLSEMRRVSGHQVVFTFDLTRHDALWIFQDYVPGIAGLSAHAAVETIMEGLGTEQVESILVPADCTDGFITAYWQGPDQYLIPDVRAATSGFSLLPPDDVEAGMARLAQDLADGTWHQRHGDLVKLTEYDVGLRLVIAGLDRSVKDRQQRDMPIDDSP